MKVCSVCRRCFDDEFLICDDPSHPDLSAVREGGRGMVGGYTIETPIEGRGETYRARHDESGQTCKIRLISAEPEAGRRFLDDAGVAAGLFHANAADVYEAGDLESGGGYFVVSEDTAGQTLRELIDKSGIPPLLESIRIIRQTAEAVHAMHLKGLTHRALRPEHIHLAEDEEGHGRVRVAGIDFGGLDERGIVTNKFTIDLAVDSLRYFAPEQCTGDGGTAKSDVYALGILLYEMLAGVPPFDAQKAAALIDMHRNMRPPDIRIDNFDLRMLLTHTITESLQKQPSFRQCSADLFARQMRHIEQLATHVSTPPPAVVVPGTPRLNFAAARVQAAPAHFVAAKIPEETPAPAVQRIEPEQAPFRDPEIFEEPAAISHYEIEEPSVIVRRKAVESPIIVRCEAKVIASPENVLQEMTTSHAAVNLQEENIPVPMPPTELPQTITKSAVESKPPPVRKSRLKLKKKRLHAFAAPTASAAVPEAETPTVILRSETPLQIVDPPKAVPVVQMAEAVPVAAVAESVFKSPTPKIVRVELPEDDIPSMDDVLEVLAKEPMPQAHVVPIETILKQAPVLAEKPAEKKAVERTPAPAAIAALELEEITAARLPTRVRVEWDKPAAQKKLQRAINRVEFTPTLLGGAGGRGQTEYVSDGGLFGAYQASISSGFQIPYRAMAAVGGVAVLASLLLFGGESVETFVGSLSAAEPATAAAQPQTPTAPQTVQTSVVLPPQQKPVKAFQEPMTEPVGAGPISATRSSVQLLEAPSEEKEVSRPVPPTNKEKTPVAATTRVISTENGKATSKVIPVKNLPEKAAESAPAKTGAATRPRVVQVPK